MKYGKKYADSIKAYDRSKQYEDIGNQIRNKHRLYLLISVCSLAKVLYHKALPVSMELNSIP